MTTFWSQANPGTRYVRMELPARYLKVPVLQYEQERFKADPFEGTSGPGIWYLIANPIILDAALKYREQNNAPIFLEIDDDYTVWEPKYGFGAFWAPKADGTENLSSVETHRIAAGLVDGIITSTSHLASRYKDLNDNIHVCRNGIDPADWPTRDPQEEDIFRIVFAGAAHLDDIQYIWRGMEWAAKQPGVECYFVGGNITMKGVRNFPWIKSLEQFRQILIDLKPDLGLRPVQATTFAKSKSDLKILEYANAGALPLVSNFEPYRAWQDTPVLFAHDLRSWEQQIKWAVKNRDQVKEDAKTVREIVLRDRHIDVVGKDWETVLANH